MNFYLLCQRLGWSVEYGHHLIDCQDCGWCDERDNNWFNAPAWSVCTVWLVTQNTVTHGPRVLGADIAREGGGPRAESVALPTGGAKTFVLADDEIWDGSGQVKKRRP